MQLSPEYKSIINSLNYINRGDARDFSIIWVSDTKARVVNENETIQSISVQRAELLDSTVAEYLVQYCELLAKVRFNQYMQYGNYPH
jgi:hypothetical protein